MHPSTNSLLFSTGDSNIFSLALQEPESAARLMATSSQGQTATSSQHGLDDSKYKEWSHYIQDELVDVPTLRLLVAGSAPVARQVWYFEEGRVIR